MKDFAATGTKIHRVADKRHLAMLLVGPDGLLLGDPKDYSPEMLTNYSIAKWILNDMTNRRCGCLVWPVANCKAFGW